MASTRNWVLLGLLGSALSGALAGSAVTFWSSREAIPVATEAQRPVSPAKAPPSRVPSVDLSDVEARVTELEDRLEAMQTQERARRSLQKYAEAVAADAKEDKDEGSARPKAPGVVDAEDPAFELAVRSVLDQVDWEKDEERKAVRQQRRSERAQRQVEMYTERLQLSSEQQQAVAKALAEQMDKFRALNDDDEAAAPLTRAERRERGAQIRTQTEQALSVVLTPEQLSTYRTIAEETSPGRRERQEPPSAAPSQ